MIFKKTIDGSSVDEATKAQTVCDLMKVGTQSHFDVRMRKNSLNQRGISVTWNTLEPIFEITVIIVHPDRNAASDRRIELLGAKAPLLHRIVGVNPISQFSSSAAQQPIIAFHQAQN